MVRNLEEIGSLVTGGIFQTSDDFDFAVRRHNQDETKLLKLAGRTATKIPHLSASSQGERTCCQAK